MEHSTEEARQRSRAVWDAMAPGWHTGREALWQFSRPVSEWMLKKLSPQPGQTILELAAGLGETGSLAAQRVGETGHVLVTDFAPEMVAAARGRAKEFGVANVEFQVLDAERMALEPASVDGVLCRWGYMLMIDPGAAFAETRRVLRRGGRLVFSVFAGPEKNPWASIVSRILVAGGHVPPPDPRAPGIFALSHPQRIQELVTSAGFADPEVEPMPLRWSFPDPETYWRFLLEMAGAISPILQRLSAEAQASVRERIHEEARSFSSGAGYEFPTLCLNVATD